MATWGRHSLFEAGADMNVATADGYTALMFAARDGNLEAVQLWLELTMGRPP